LFSAELREYIFENIENIITIDNLTMQKIHRRFKAGEIGLESPEVKADSRDIFLAYYFFSGIPQTLKTNCVF
jgi:hypothetical protein